MNDDLRTLLATLDPKARDDFRRVLIHDRADRDAIASHLLDPSTFHPAGGCKHRDTTDPTLLAAILKVKDGAGEGYWWVECGTCDTAWQVPHYAAAKNVG